MPTQHDQLDDPRIRSLHRALMQRPPRLRDDDPAMARASVALLVRPTGSALEILLIERPKSEGDPWAGHMALPGGRRGPDEEALDTAIRETLEEVGVDLHEGAMLIGRLDDIHPNPGGPQIAVAPFVFAVPPETVVKPNPLEVARALWIPLEHLADPRSASEHLHVLPDGGRVPFPALAYHHHVIWGLTYRMLIQFLGITRTANVGEVH